MPIITDEMWYAMCDCYMSMPVPLHEAIISKSFVYHRKYGLFYVAGSSHQIAMSLLLAWDNGYACGVDYADDMGLEYAHESADYWLQNTAGTAFRSSLDRYNSIVLTGHMSHLNIGEKRIFKTLELIGNNPR